MKNMKKLASILLALVMVLSLATTTFAAGETGTITISNAIPTQTYNIYEIFTLESYVAGGAHSYTVVDAWKDFVTTGAGKDYVTIENGYVTWNADKKDDANVKAFGVAALAYATEKNILATKTATAPAAAEGATTSTVTFDGLELGYYLVSSSLGTICSLDTTNTSADIQEKNKAPESTKEVEEDSTSTWGEKNDADIAQLINYKSTIKVEAGAVNYKFRDTMSAGLTLKADSIKVSIDDAEYAATDNGEERYVIASTDNGFTITFNNAWIAKQVGKTITITYSATLNENAVIAGEGNQNKADLEYGNKPEDERDHTPEDITKTYTWEFKVFKYTGENTPLSGAVFKLYKMVDNTKHYAVLVNGKLNTWTTDETQATTLVSDTNGYITVSGLDSDTYYLTETKAPTGYNKLSGDITVIIDNAGNVKNSANGEALANKTVKVLNNAGTELPSTGGIGTTIFYTLGGILVLAAVVLLVTKKRTGAAN